jgi:hypothetical protein
VERPEAMRHDQTMSAGVPSCSAATSSGLCCPACGFVPSCGPQARALRADLGVVWLISKNDDMQESRFCQACAPRDLAGEIACVVCADGPLLAAEFSQQVLSAWLTERGWHTRGDSRDHWLCPRCAPLI